MAESVDEVQCFLKECDELLHSQIPDECILPKIVGKLSLCKTDVPNHIIDWILHYLEDKKCPYRLAVAIAKETRNLLLERLSLRTEQSESVEANTLNSVNLYNGALRLLREACSTIREKVQIEDIGVLAPPFFSCVSSMKNRRRTMEDRHVIHPDLNFLLDLKDMPQFSYYAVFDGHAGVDAASYAAAHLHVNIMNHSLVLTDTPVAIAEAFTKTDDDFAAWSAKEKRIKSGSTAVCALINEKTVHLSWLGDSQAAIVKAGQAEILTSMHKPERQDERERVEALGGSVFHYGTWRVNGCLAISRAFGDIDHKPFIISEPEMKTVTLDGTEDFLVLACDGLWDGMTAEDVSTALYTYLLNEENAVEVTDSIAAHLADLSVKHGSDDNITVIVIFLRDPNVIREYAKNLPVKLNGRQETTDDMYCEQSIVKPNTLDLHPFPAETDLKSSEDVASMDFPEASSLSELPTPPIDELLASQKFEGFSKDLQSLVSDSDLVCDVNTVADDIDVPSAEQISDSADKENVFIEMSKMETNVAPLAVVGSEIPADVLQNETPDQIEQSIGSPSTLNPYAEPFVMKNFSPSDYAINSTTSLDNKLEESATVEESASTKIDELLVDLSSAETCPGEKVFTAEQASELVSVKSVEIAECTKEFILNDVKLDAHCDATDTALLNHFVNTSALVQKLDGTSHSLPENRDENFDTSSNDVVSAISQEVEVSASTSDRNKVAASNNTSFVSAVMESKQATEDVKADQDQALSGLVHSSNVDSYPVSASQVNPICSSVDIDFSSDAIEQITSAFSQIHETDSEELIFDEDVTETAESAGDMLGEIEKGSPKQNVTPDVLPEHPSYSSTITSSESGKDVLSLDTHQHSVSNVANIIRDKQEVADDIASDANITEMQKDLISMSSAEESHPEEVSVDLQSIPVGIPEADGVSEDIDSDSEKDGGWSYTKGAVKTVGKKMLEDSGSSKASSHKVEVGETSKKDAKAAIDVKSKVKPSPSVDKVKKHGLEKTVEVKEKPKVAKSFPLAPKASSKPTVDKTTKGTISQVRKDILTTKTSKVSASSGSSTIRSITATTTRNGTTITTTRNVTAATTTRNVTAATTTRNVTAATSSRNVTADITRSASAASKAANTLPKNIQAVTTTRNRPISKPATDTNAAKVASRPQTLAVSSAPLRRVAQSSTHTRPATTTTRPPVASAASSKITSRAAVQKPKTSGLPPKDSTSIESRPTSLNLEKVDVKETKDIVNKQLAAKEFTKSRPQVAAKTFTTSRPQVAAKTFTKSSTFSKASTNPSTKPALSRNPSAPTEKVHASKVVPKAQPKANCKPEAFPKLPKTSTPVSQKKELSTAQKCCEVPRGISEKDKNSAESTPVTEEEKFTQEVIDKEIIKEQTVEVANPESPFEVAEQSNDASCALLESSL